HIERLTASLHGIGMKNPYNTQQWLAIFQPLINNTENQYIYLQITRGVAPKRDHAFPANIEPTIFVMCNNIVPFAGLETGVKAVTMNDSRWQYCNIKAIALLAHLLHRQTAVEQDCAEAILIKNGLVTEGAASNVFAVIDGVIITPPKSERILAGITRDVMIELAEKHGLPHREADITADELKTASEIWVTSSTREIVPVVELDEQPVGNGKVGTVWQQMNDIFQAYKQTLLTE
ncbi:partial D-alanine transaminase, partial [Patescibacteria group bacterium]